MDVSFNGYGEKVATFTAGSTLTETGVPVKVISNGIVTKCSSGENFCGVCLAVRGGYATVQLSGYVRMKCDAKIGVGYKTIAAGSSGVTASTTGREYLVLDSTDTQVGFIL